MSTYSSRLPEICLLSSWLILTFIGGSLFGEDSVKGIDGTELLNRFFESETRKITQRCLADINSVEDWRVKRPEYLLQLREMLGLSPWPEKGELNATITGSTIREGVVAERVQFQSSPGLYVTGTFFRPEEQTEPLPAILYVCGHGRVKENGVSFGNKATYQHHGSWFAKNGYVCLIIDTIQLGEIEGIHHGTYSKEMWWWHNYGYTSAGVEAWNGIRAIDFLQSRSEVDGEKIGITGRSGGGAYSWWVAALDERIKAAVPVAGITSMQNHIVDGCIEGHCDCMYMVNTYAWDFPLLAAMVAPRPLLISNTDKDRIFPLDGVVDVYSKTRRIYELHDALNHIGLNIAEGPHKDTQELRVNAFHWMNRFLKNEDPLIESPATKLFSPEELKVFKEIPSDERTTTIQESFIPLADDKLPTNKEELDALEKQTLNNLRNITFRNVNLDVKPELKKSVTWNNGTAELTMYSYHSDEIYDLPLYVLKSSPDVATDVFHVIVCDEEKWLDVSAELGAGFSECPTLNTDSKEVWKDTSAFNFIQSQKDVCLVYCVPRGIGPTAWTATAKQDVHIKRRMTLLGHTVDSLRTYDVYQCLRALHTLSPRKIELHAAGPAADWGSIAAILFPGIDELVLYDIGLNFQGGPYLLQVSQFLTKRQAILLAADRAKAFALKEEHDKETFDAQELQKTIQQFVKESE